MWKTLAFSIAIGAAVTLTPAGAGAMPLTQAVSAAAGTDLTLVRDGCGRGYRFSNRRQACVPQFDDGPRYYDGRGPRRERGYDPDAAAAAAAAATALGIIGAISGNNNRGGPPRSGVRGGNRGGNPQAFQGGRKLKKQ